MTLDSINFKIHREKITQNEAEIIGSNPQQSVVELFLSRCPQIVKCCIVKKSEKEVQIETSFDLLRKFRIFYHIIFCILLILSWVLIITGEAYVNKDTQGWSSSGIIGFLIFLLTTILLIKSQKTNKWEALKNQLYENIAKNGFVIVKVLQERCFFLDVLPYLCFYLLVFIAVLIHRNLNINVSIFFKFFSFYMFMFEMVIITIILIVLMCLMFFKHSILIKMSFCMLSFALCLPAVFYGNLPAVTSTMRDLQKIENSYKKLAYIINEPFVEQNESLTTSQSNLLKVKKPIQRLSMIFWGFLFMLLLIIIYIIGTPFYLLIEMARILDEIQSAHPDYFYYHEALMPGKLNKLSDILIVALWLAISAANLTGIYFSLSLLGRIFFGMDHLFSSSVANLFYNNIRSFLVFGLFPIISINNIELFHKVIILIYSFPLLLIVLIVLWKNSKSFIEKYNKIKTRSVKYHGIEEHLTNKIAEICKFAGVRKPIIRVIDQPSINANSTFMGFPIFKNILTVNKGAWDNLHNLEYELDGLLAHEVWHLKKHTFKRKLLCFLSDYTLFGNGFLALLQDSFQIEKEADDFAKEWLENKIKNRKKTRDGLRCLLKKLEKQEEEQCVVDINNWFTGGFNFAKMRAFFNKKKTLGEHDDSSKTPQIRINLRALLDDNSYRKKIFENYKISSKALKIKFNLIFLYQIYFG